MKKYSYEQMLGIMNAYIDCVEGRAEREVARKNVLTIAKDFPIHNFDQELKKVSDYLSGKGWYGYSYPSGWAKAFIEVTNQNPNVIKALREQQRLYFEKDGKFNNKLQDVLDNLPESIQSVYDIPVSTQPRVESTQKVINKSGTVEYKMSPEEYFKKIIELYHQSRIPKYYNPNIKRGRSSSISSDIEDLTALFIALNNPKQCFYFIDQPMKFEGSTTKYPDVVIQNHEGKIENLIDVKTDIGWKRDGLYPFCLEWEKRIESVKGTSTSFLQGEDKSIQHGDFTKNLKYHVVVVTKINSGNRLLSDYERVKNELTNVQLYILSDGIHPNNYKYSANETINKIIIYRDEFDRLISCIRQS